MSPRKPPEDGIDAPDKPPKEGRTPAAFRDVIVPETKEQFEAIMRRGVARALEMADTPKDLTEALKVAVSCHERLYGAADDDGAGSGFVKNGRNGHGG